MSIFYRFNSFTQSISPSSQDVAMGRPITPQAMSTSLPKTSEVFYDFKPLAPLVSSTRPSSTKVASLQPGQFLVPNHPRFKRLMEMQAKFCANDGKLVWQKLPKDMPMYYAVAGCVTVAVVWSVLTLYKFTSPPTNNQD